MSIRHLMDVPEAARDVNWLQRSLQCAIELELATIPPYLCGWWSIVDEDHPVAKDFARTVLEEMLHMGLVCNMLTTLGGTPVINTVTTVPKYPGGLPGGVRPELVVWLAGFSRAMTRAVYMEIEYPETGPITRFLDQTFPTIGAFYTAILEAFKRVDPCDIRQERQLSATFSELRQKLVPILSVDDAVNALTTIKEQGEGTSQYPFPGCDRSDRAHYYRFGEFYYGRRLVEIHGRWLYAGDEVQLPEAHPMADVPSGGYPEESRAFDMRYSDVLNDLQSAWETDMGQATLNVAIGKMFLLKEPARELMMMKRPAPSHGNFGPSFLFISKK